MTSQIQGVIGSVGYFYSLLIFAYILMSWFPIRGAIYDLYTVIGSVVEPYLGLFRRFVPVMGNVDFSPILAFLALQFILVPGLQFVARLLIP